MKGPLQASKTLFFHGRGALSKASSPPSRQEIPFTYGTREGINYPLTSLNLLRMGGGDAAAGC